jgi:hypothetical protein
MSAALAADIEAVIRRVDDTFAAQRVCLSVIEHPFTPPKLAGEVFVLLRWIGDNAKAVA